MRQSVDQELRGETQTSSQSCLSIAVQVANDTGRVLNLSTTPNQHENAVAICNGGFESRPLFLIEAGSRCSEVTGRGVRGSGALGCGRLVLRSRLSWFPRTPKLGRFYRFIVECRAMDVHELLRSSEGKTLEFKRDISSPKGVMKTLVAFANTAGGILLIGVEDKTRNVLGVTDPLSLEERLASLISDSISPHLVPEIEVLPWRSETLVAVQVHPSGDRHPTSSFVRELRTAPMCVWARQTGKQIFP